MEFLTENEHSLTLKEDYEGVLQDLQHLCDTLFEQGQAEDAAFISTVSMRLRAWGSYIDLDQNGLKSVEKVALLAAQTRVLLHDLKVQCESVHEPQGPLESDWRTRCNQSMDSLNTLCEPIRTVNTPSQNETEKATVDRINDRLRILSFRQYPRHATWILLPEPVPAAKQDLLLGAIVADPFKPLENFITIDASRAKPPSGQSGECEFTLSRSSSSSLSLGVQLSGVLGLNLFARARESAYTIKAPEVETKTIDNDENILLRLDVSQKRSISELLMKSGKRKVYLVAGVMRASKLERTTTRSQSIGGASQFSLRRRILETSARASDPTLGAALQSLKSSESKIVGLNVIFALKYRVIKSKRFSRKLSVGSHVEASKLTR